MFSSNKHFEQTMKSKGEVMLCGRKFKVDSHTILGRSWGRLHDKGH